MKREQREYYDNLAKLYDWRLEDARDDIPFYVKLAKESGGPVLELGCGTGRVVLPIAQAGMAVVGLDLSPDMLHIASQKLAKMLAAIQKRAQFIQGNMASFALERQFSLVILPANQFRELPNTEDQLSCLRCIHLHLNEHGSVVIEMTNPFRSIKRWSVGEVFHRKVGYCKETGTIVECLFETTAVNLIEQWIEQKTIYIEHLDNGSTISHAGQSQARLIFPKELDLLMDVTGFEVSDRWGDYDYSGLADDSPYSIIRARARSK